MVTANDHVEDALVSIATKKRRERQIQRLSFQMVIMMLALPVSVSAHGTIGKRFFPTTLTIDDPAVNDEFDMLTDHRKVPEDKKDSALTTKVSVGYAKRITPHLGITVEADFVRLDLPGDNDVHHGFGNLGVGAKYVFFESALHETLLTAAFEAEVGGTGSKDVGAEPFSIFSPQMFFGHGFGDVPYEGAKFLRPMAITGLVSANLPSRGSEPDTVTTGMTLQYSVPYLRSMVNNIALMAPVKNLIPVVEVLLETCVNQGCAGDVTGTVNPGILWINKGVGQLGLEASIPINRRTGSNVGVLFQLHLFLDEIFPNTLGTPLFEGKPHRH